MADRRDKPTRTSDETGNQRKQPGKGAGAEKGDARRDEHGHHSGPTRPGGSSRGNPGSESNPEKDE
jgi:hypothetical protein